MKTKLLFILGYIFWYGQMFSQSYPIVDRIVHFDRFVQSLQSRQVNATIRLDSIRSNNYDAANSAYTLNSLQTFTFDSNNWNTEDSYNTWDANNNTLMQQGKTEYTYTGSGAIAEMTYYYFDFNQNALVPSQKTSYTYNASGQLIEVITQQYSIPGSQFVNQQKEVYTYAQTTDPKPTLVQIYQWDTANTSWGDFQRANITYNGNFQFTDIVMETKDNLNNTWVNSQHFTRSYDANFRLTEYIIQQWQGNAWVNYSKKSVSYTPMGSYEEIIVENFSWDTTSSLWSINGKQVKQVDTTDIIIQVEYFYWDSASSQLVGSTKIVYSYNTNDIEAAYFSWDSQTQDWKTDNLQKDLYAYDMSVAKNDLILPYNYGGNTSLTNSLFTTGIPSFDHLNHKLLNKESFYRATVSDPWVPTYKQTYLYTDTAAGIDDSRQIAAKIYPNPFNDNIHFEVASDAYSINVYDLNGRLLFAVDLNSHTSVNLSFLNKGVYIYKIQTDKGTASGQIIKK